MGKFVNTSYKDTVSGITDMTKNILKNPYYLFNDKKACNTNYYHINPEKSTMDEAARIPYSELGEDCPFRFNLIKDFFVYGIDKIQLSLENGDNGLESGEITGEAIILPDTITPYPGDYFEIEHIEDSTWLFRVNQVDKDTLDDGANIWKISYKLEHTDNSQIVNLVEDDYNMIIDYVGTEYNPIIKSSNFELVKTLDDISVQLKRYYKELFYNSRVQTFTFTHTYQNIFYDPFMIEFLIRNKVLENSGQRDYIYVDHKLKVPATFSIDYNKTFYRAFETRDLKLLSKSVISSSAECIRNVVSIFNSRPENYFELNYRVYPISPGQCIHNIIQCLPEVVVDHILRNEYFDDYNGRIYNILIKYFNGCPYCEDDFDCIENIDYTDDINIFYLIPLLIFSIESYILGIVMKKDNIK